MPVIDFSCLLLFGVLILFILNLNESTSGYFIDIKFDTTIFSLTKNNLQNV